MLNYHAFTSYTYDYVMICRFTHHVSRAPDAALPSSRPFAPPITSQTQTATIKLNLFQCMKYKT